MGRKSRRRALPVWSSLWLFAPASASAAGCRPTGPHVARRAREGKVRKDGAQDARQFAACTWTYIQRTPQRARAPAAQGCAEGAPPWGVFLWLLSLHKQRK